MKVIIVDDESLAISRMEKLLSSYDDMQILQSFGNAMEALKYIRSHDVDVVFCDINMPVVSGILYSKGSEPIWH